MLSNIFTSLIPIAQAANKIPVMGEQNSTVKSPIATIESLTANLVNLFLIIGGGAALLFVLLAGIQYISAGGSPEKAKTARTSLINALIGIAIFVSAYAIIRLGALIGNTVVSFLK